MKSSCPVALSKKGDSLLFVGILLVFVLAGRGGADEKSNCERYLELDTTGPVAISDDGDLLAIVAEGAYPPDDSSIVQIRNARTTYPNGTMIRSSQGVRHLAFVSKDFGFLMATSNERRDGSRATSARMEQLKLTGERKVVFQEFSSQVSSLAVSTDRTLVAICIQPPDESLQGAECHIFSLEDGRKLADFAPGGIGMMQGVFVGTTNNLLLAAKVENGGTAAYLVEARTGQLLQECPISPISQTVNSIVASPVLNDVFISENVGIYRIDARLGHMSADVFYTTTIRGGTQLCASWLAVNPTGTLLAVGERDFGRGVGAGTQIIEIPVARRRSPILKTVGPMVFSPDGDWLCFGDRRFQLQQLR